MTKEKEKRAKTVQSPADENVLRMYINEISRIPLLTREEEDKIARAAVRGNSAARNKLINSNLRFVITVAKKYQGMGIPLTDLVNEGNIGLIKAVEKFDVTRGYHFISYAVWWIRQSILKALYEKAKLIRLPTNHANNLIHIEQARKMLAGDTENQVQEIAEMLNVKENYVEDIIAISREVVSLEKLVDNDAGASPLGNFVVDNRYDAPEQAVIQTFLEHDIEEMLSTLENKEAEVIRLHYGLGKRIPMSLSEIGDYFNLTKERIRQIEEKALMRLQHFSRRDKLAAYVA
ncbi:MAG: RNA polymerase sigma factor RpoD/SigA [Treponema sp.]|jgi:RNA polymerase primary sigma factor|nr:RNA polymerase sigma factor RpoD/SigA [Treponema sp.]